VVVGPEFAETPFALVLSPIGWEEGPTEEVEDAVMDIAVVTSESTVVPGSLEIPIGWFVGAGLTPELLPEEPTADP